MHLTLAICRRVPVMATCDDLVPNGGAFGLACNLCDRLTSTRLKKRDARATHILISFRPWIFFFFLHVVGNSISRMYVTIATKKDKTNCFGTGQQRILSLPTSEGFFSTVETWARPGRDSLDSMSEVRSGWIDVSRKDRMDGAVLNK